MDYIVIVTKSRQKKKRISNHRLNYVVQYVQICIIISLEEAEQEENEDEDLSLVLL